MSWWIAASQALKSQNRDGSFILVFHRPCSVLVCVRLSQDQVIDSLRKSHMNHVMAFGAALLEPGKEEEMKTALREARETYMKDMGTLSWFVMQDPRIPLRGPSSSGTTPPPLQPLLPTETPPPLALNCGAPRRFQLVANVRCAPAAWHGILTRAPQCAAKSGPHGPRKRTRRLEKSEAGRVMGSNHGRHSGLSEGEHSG
ncbi:hypothetical protein C8R45DRAFT_1164157 [Mycena sanguinolenta]|nr:hypothetical protein C8R45DRAFT_1164157 [Mycena sanguinolenta]